MKGNRDQCIWLCLLLIFVVPSIGSRDVMDGEDFDETLEDNIGTNEQGRRSRSRKHKSKKPPRYSMCQLSVF